MFMLISNEPIKVPHLQKLANQLMENALVTEMITILFVKARKTLAVWWNEEVLIEKKWNKDMGNEKFISTRFRYISKLFRGAKEKESW